MTLKGNYKNRSTLIIRNENALKYPLQFLKSVDYNSIKISFYIFIPLNLQSLSLLSVLFLLMWAVFTTKKFIEINRLIVHLFNEKKSVADSNSPVGLSSFISAMVNIRIKQTF